MGRRIVFLLVVFAIVARAFSQDAAPTATPRRGWLSRLLHPFSSEPIPKYKNPRLRGLTLDLQITPQTVKLSEVRQLAIKISVTNLSKRPIPLDFPTNASNTTKRSPRAISRPTKFLSPRFSFLHIWNYKSDKSFWPCREKVDG